MHPLRLHYASTHVAAGPSPRGSNWVAKNNPTRWVWASDPEAPVFTVSEHEAPFGSYYKIKMMLPDGEIYSVKGQKTDKETWFAVAADLYARWGSAAGFDLSRRPEQWQKLAAAPKGTPTYEDYVREWKALQARFPGAVKKDSILPKDRWEKLMLADSDK